MRCELGDQNDSYFLCADDAQDSKVFLLVSVEQISLLVPHRLGAEISPWPMMIAFMADNS